MIFTASAHTKVSDAAAREKLFPPSMHGYWVILYFRFYSMRFGPNPGFGEYTSVEKY